jgi:group I intron endonuclease
VNDKCYVGQTSQEKAENRWSQHKYRPHGLLKLAFQKYGFENFEFSTICEISQGDGWREALDAREILEISRLNTMTPLGYNLQSGGGHPIVHQETREKIRVSKKGANNYNYGKHLSEETKARMSVSLSGENHWNFGKHPTEQTKTKLKESHISENNPKIGKEVEQWSKDRKDLIEVYTSMSSAARKLGVQPQSISRCCCGRKPSAYGFYWKLREQESI